jgi:hypothetical protein
MSAQQSSAPSPARDIVVEALDKLRMASLLLIIATIMAGAVSFSMLGALLTGNIFAVLAGSVAVIAVAIIGFIIILVSVYGYLLPSVNQFATWRPQEFSTARTLIRVGYIAGPILMIIGLATIFILIGIALIVVGGILLLVGEIGVIILLFKLRDAFNSTLFLVAAILAILGIFIPLLGFIAWILVFVESGSVKSKILAGSIQV